MMANALARLVGDEQAFVADDLGRRPRYLQGADADGFADLLSLDDVDQVVAGTGLRAPAFRLVRAGTTLATARVTRTARIGSRPVHDLVDVAAVHREFAAGATIVLQGLHRSWAPVAAFCRSLEAALTHRVQANAYLTPPVAQGLNLHGDPHDVFALQTHGVKRWVVEPPGEPRWELELRPGDVLYLPAGTRHAAQTIDRPSLHLTIGVRATTWRELVDRAVTSALGSTPGLDRALPGGWAERPDALTTELARHLVAVAEALTDAAVAEQVPGAVADRFWSSRLPDLTGGLRDVLELDELDDLTRLRVRPAATCRVRRDGDRATIVLGDRRLTAPAAVAPVVERIVALGTFAPKELDELVDEPSRLVLCRRLVREGLLTIDRDVTAGRA
jgi:bifunctional lysine-specific demethylase and histidyl-hydroxylase NO66